MPIRELSEARRVTRDFKIYLGERRKKVAGSVVKVDRADPIKGSYPTETDYFVMDDPSIPADVREIYGPKPKSLRVMLYQEFDAKNADGDELVFNLNNRAYGVTKGLRCIGHGRSYESPDFAVVFDERWAVRIAQATEQESEPLPSRTGLQQWRVRCIGRDCPKYLHMTEQPDQDDPSKTRQALAPGHDTDASCKAVGILRGLLLYPDKDPRSENYSRPLGVFEIATGSLNAFLNIQSDFDLKVRVYAGRTAGIPVTLIRKPTTTRRPFVQVHFPVALGLLDLQEVQRWAAIPLQEVFLSEEQRENLKRLAATPLGLTVDSVSRLLPAHLVPKDLQGPVAAVEASGTGDPRDAEPGRSDAPGPPTVPVNADPAGIYEREPGPLLVKAQIDELKTLAGGREDPTRPGDQIGNPWRQEAIERLRHAIVAMNAETGSTVTKFADLREEHAEWLKGRLRALPRLEGQA